MPSWNEQYERMKRRRTRLSEQMHGRTREEHNERILDDFHAFFESCFHLRDWIINDDGIAIPEQEVRRLGRRWGQVFCWLILPSRALGNEIAIKLKFDLLLPPDKHEKATRTGREQAQLLAPRTEKGRESFRGAKQVRSSA